MKLQYIAPPKPSAKDAKKEKPSDEKKDSLEDVVLKAKLGYMTGIRKDNTTLYKELSSALKEEFPSSVPLLSELLSFALECPVPSTEADEYKWRLGEVELVYNAMQKTNKGPIDELDIASYFGLNEPDDLDDDEEAKAKNKEMKEQRDLLKKVLLERATLAGNIADKDSSGVDAFNLAVTKLKQWVSLDNLKEDKEKTQVSVLLAKHARICQNKKATAISILLNAKKDITGKEMKQIDDELVKLYDLHGEMGYLVENLKEVNHCRFPVVKRGV